MVAPAPDLAVLNPQMYSHCQEKVLQNATIGCTLEPWLAFLKVAFIFGE